MPRTRECGPRAPRARGARTPHAPRASRRARRRTGRTLVVSAPPAGAGGARVEWHARSDRHEEKRKRRRPTQRANAPARLPRREPPVVYARAARVARASSVAPCAAPSLRSKRQPQKRRETRTTTGDREQEKIITVTNLNLNSCGPERACPPRGRASHEPLTSAMRTSWSSSACDIPVGAHCNQLLGRVVRAAACFAPHAKRILRHEVRRDRDHWGGQGFAISAGLH